eukprot:CAMPEP_0172914092 /NCGR_PEP_ID=MMETSP1075-20121228/191659_1 /TAXON_ID=2916 /ORGANISM="Ceratium fusus, Strain PA161109" /LENGTH=119 /DNA_ID=CAMNT_0013772947 /DNA_START=138 /DNA_END=494 /DNA_ORIENTATION=-
MTLHVLLYVALLAHLCIPACLYVSQTPHGLTEFLVGPGLLALCLFKLSLVVLFAALTQVRFSPQLSSGAPKLALKPANHPVKFYMKHAALHLSCDIQLASSTPPAHSLSSCICSPRPIA